MLKGRGTRKVENHWLRPAKLFLIHVSMDKAALSYTKNYLCNTNC